MENLIFSIAIESGKKMSFNNSKKLLWNTITV